MHSGSFTIFSLYVSYAAKPGNEKRAIPILNCNPLIRDLYQKQVANGKEKMAAIGICMHKTLRILYGMLKNNTALDPDIDKANQSRSRKETANAPKNKEKGAEDVP